jgi:chorismate mutase
VVAHDHQQHGTGDVDPAVREELARLRESIDNIDAAVVHMLAERFKCTQQVGHLKAAHQLPPADPAREARQIARLRASPKAPSWTRRSLRSSSTSSSPR